MHPARFRLWLVTCYAIGFVAFSQSVPAATLCVNPSGSNGCYSSIQVAVNHAAVNDVIKVAAGTYYEEVDIGIPVSIIGVGASASIIDATNLAHGIFVDGLNHAGLHDVTI